jgi:hypothetical protein
MSDNEKMDYLAQLGLFKDENPGYLYSIVEGTRKYTHENIVKKNPWATNTIFSYILLRGLYEWPVKPAIAKVFAFFTGTKKEHQENKPIVRVIAGVFSLLIAFSFHSGDIRNVFTWTQEPKFKFFEKKSIQKEYSNYIENFDKNNNFVLSLNSQ